MSSLKIIAFQQTQTVSLTALNFFLYCNFTTTLLLRRYFDFWPGGHLEVESPGQRVWGSIISWVGVIIFSVLIGFVIDSVMEKMDDLKKGRSTVVESEHTLILGKYFKSEGACIA